MRKLMIPREHGAWAMLLLPYVSGFTVAADSDSVWVPMLLGAVGILSLFMARAPLMRLAKRRYRRGDFGPEARDNWYSAAVFLATGLIFFGTVTLAYGQHQLWQLAVAAVILSLTQTWLALTRGERSLIAEVTGVILLALTAPLGFYLVSGCCLWGRVSVTLWAANASFFGASIFNVKMKVDSMVKRRQRFSTRQKLAQARGSIIYAAVLVTVWLLLAAAGLAPVLAPAAFIPLVVYVAWSVMTVSSRLNIKTEGFVQLGLSLAFTIMLVATWRYGW